MKLEELLHEVWRQALQENANLVEVEGARFPVQRTRRKRLRQVDFEFEGQPIRGIEQNPETKSRWAEMARAGQKVMQFISGTRYIAVIADGKLTLYGRGLAGKEPAAKPHRGRSASPDSSKQGPPSENSGA